VVIQGFVVARLIAVTYLEEGGPDPVACQGSSITPLPLLFDDMASNDVSFTPQDHKLVV